ncbi:hypothetical protein JOC77_001972 [Peribacillus deserti]|uniref:Uncharacterized protein n=1 Tax=Peribacillus deserti TaxID=673318 RepID=A0ABS2QHC5_9BACI|nr:PCYCGC motif-containing (lipo)protein [Peribacillus deserti]MBM7692542.1 hypothetical protein [Peribacillus deserti]
MNKDNIIKALFLLFSFCLIMPDSIPQAEAAVVKNSQKDCHFHERKGIADIKEKTPSAEILPHFLYGKPEHIRKIYLNAAKHKNILKFIPCYCGCGESAGHMDTYQCFVYENHADGSIVWDNHAAMCGICLDTASTAILQSKEGKSLTEVRKIIEDRYKKGFKKPTPTPMPK